jgi:RNA polymerase sigma-70 factor (ECF subfamily)
MKQRGGASGTGVSVLEDCQANKPGAWRELFRRYARTIFRWAVMLGLSPAEAEDAAQEVLVVAVRKIDQCQDEAGLGPWLYRITRHIVANARRKAWFRKGVLEGDAPEPAFEHRTPESRENELSVRRCFGLLTVRQREVLMLSDVEGYTRDEIAAMLGIPPGTVASRLRLARVAFRGHWEKEWRSTLENSPTPESGS